VSARYPVRGKESGAVPIDGVYADYAEDAASAAARYKDGVTFTVTVEELSKTSSGFMFVRRLRNGPGDLIPVTIRVYYPETAGERLQGCVGEVITAHGRVGSSGKWSLGIWCK
jgi:hypothetical protein